MATLTTGKIAEVLFENAIETFESQDMLLDKVDFFQPDAGDMQNAGNYIWRTVQQHAPVISGWDMAGSEQGIIEETYPAVLNQDIASAMAVQAGIFYRSTATSGYNFISEAQAIMNERQLVKDTRCFLLNDRDTLTFGSDLAARQTLQGRPESTWNSGQIGQNVAEFDVYTGSFLPNIAGGASPNTTVTGNQSFAPSAGTVTAATGVVTNIDYRTADIAVAASASYNVGDKVRFQNPGAVSVDAVGLDDKTDTGQPMTFTIVAKPDGTTISVYPKPIAADDSALSDLEKAYANINTTILNAALVIRLNTDTSVKTNLFWDRNAVEVIGGSIPANLFKEFAGKKVINATMKNGQKMYMVYDGDIKTMKFTFRLFTWNGITIRNPSAVGVAVRGTAT